MHPRDKDMETATRDRHCHTQASALHLPPLTGPGGKGTR